MCYPAPGPRCSSHAKKRFIELKHQKMTMMKEGGHSFEEIRAMQQKVDAAELDFDSTPAGIARLEHRQQRNGDKDGRIAERIANCKELRRQQLAAIKAKDAGDMKNHKQVKHQWSGTNELVSPDENRIPLKSADNAETLRKEYLQASQAVADNLSTEESKAVYWFTSE